VARAKAFSVALFCQSALEFPQTAKGRA